MITIVWSIVSTLIYQFCHAFLIYLFRSQWTTTETNLRRLESAQPFGRNRSDVKRVDTPLDELCVTLILTSQARGRWGHLGPWGWTIALGVGESSVNSSDSRMVQGCSGFVNPSEALRWLQVEINDYKISIWINGQMRVGGKLWLDTFPFEAWT